MPQDLLPYWKVQNDLKHDNGIVLYKNRILIPSSMRKEVLARLHSAHRGIEATKRRASQTVWWPSIANDIVTTVEACHNCQVLQPSQQREPLSCDTTPTRPFESVSADLFSLNGKTYLIYADRYSGWSEVHEYAKDATSKTTMKAFRKFFANLGVPSRLRTDGGPQFSSYIFSSFMNKWHVQHDMSTPNFAQSNGHAEANVKRLKHLIAKASPKGDIYDSDELIHGIIELQNTPRQDGLSPAMILLGRPLRSLVPIHRSAFDPKWHDVAMKLDKREDSNDHATKRYDAHSKPLPPLKIGDNVRIQDPESKHWDKLGVITGIGKRRDYIVKTPSGSILWRNRRFLRIVPVTDAGAPTPPAATSPVTTARADRRVGFHTPAEPLPRRSSREVKPNRKYI